MNIPDLTDLVIFTLQCFCIGVIWTVLVVLVISIPVVAWGALKELLKK